MDFLAVIRQVGGALDAAQICYALIGGFAMALRGSVQDGNRLDWALMTDYVDLFGLRVRTGTHARLVWQD